MIRNYADERELKNMVNELLGIQYNIAKANRTDRRVQNLANLVKRMKSGSYRPNPTRRVYIPKGITGIQAETGRTLWEIWTGTGGRKDEDYRIREVCQAKPKSKRRKKTRYL